MKLKFMWDKLLTENQIIMQIRYGDFPSTVYYLFPTKNDADKFIEKTKKDDSIIQESIKIRQISEIFS